MLQPGLLSRKNSFANGTQRPLPSVVLKSQAHVVGDIHHQTLTIEKGAHFEGRATQTHGANGRQPESASKEPIREARKADVAAR